MGIRPWSKILGIIAEMEIPTIQLQDGNPCVALRVVRGAFQLVAG